MSKRTMSSSKACLNETDDQREGSKSPSLKSSEEGNRNSVEKKDYCSERSASPVKERKKRHKRTSRKRSLSYSPRREDKESVKDDGHGANRCLGVFGLSSYTDERDLKEVFSAYGDVEKLCLIYDKQSGHSKGFGFVYFESLADACTARKQTQGLVLDGRHIRVDFSLTQEPHPSTPGRYYGRQRYQSYRSSSFRSRDDFYYRPRPRERTYYDDTHDRKRFRDEYDDYYDRSSRKPYSRRH
ncbi:hypothetical protein EGW08_012133 [Elysia chlorotica]|uniref:RRM domain-containing protein n=1 Tax=Elysia chlorotica TaxID=188477 RepID=A0A433TEU3_ELYCH|nr:hypothetical protein EGW08_012133 [Elysia chlorotica]